MSSLPFTLPPLAGKVFLVTGGNTGVGFHTVSELAKHGARVYMGARSAEKATAAIDKIRAESRTNSNADVDIHFLQMDLMDLQSVVAAAKQFTEKETKLHGLVNNAGIMATPFALSGDGFEAQWQTNYLSHWVLTWHLLGVLSRTVNEEEGLEAGSVRVVNVTSDGHNFAPKVGIDFKAVNQEKGGLWSRYGMSKVGNILHAKQLNKMFGPEGAGGPGRITGIWTAAVHPGHLDTNLNKQTAFPKFVNTILKVVGAYSHASEGAYNSLFAVASSDFKASDSGQYFVPGQKKKQPSKVARDMQLAGRLWQWTEDEMRKRKLLD
ncbi:short chain dehydrogenase [Aspergillus ustus]|uniref:Short chain dehydrogenase n=1 Tax=Aspergillus ustus TaxID=40382 RepID=A0A0C1C3Q9_ASPUT|nr:short chain dehydrogenase [Aspergillus ustus]